MPFKTKENTTQGSNQQSTAPLNPSSVLVSNSVGKVIPHLNLSRQEMPCKLGLSTPWNLKLKWMSRDCSLGMSNSSRKRWKLSKQTVIRVQINLVQHTRPSMKHFTKIKIPLLWETQETIQWTWNSKVSLLLNFMPRMLRLGLARIETPDMAKSPWGEFTVLDLLMTNALVLLGLSIIHQWLHHSWILGQQQERQLRQQQQVCLLACGQLSEMWSHLHRHIVCSHQLKHFGCI